MLSQAIAATMIRHYADITIADEDTLSDAADSQLILTLLMMIRLCLFDY
jgi:hypothetical protein